VRTTTYEGEDDRKKPAGVTIFSTRKEVVNVGEIRKLGIAYLLFGLSYIIGLVFFVAHLTADNGLTRKAGEGFALVGLASIPAEPYMGLAFGYPEQMKRPRAVHRPFFFPARSRTFTFGS
jgi:hypothetical protein